MATFETVDRQTAEKLRTIGTLMPSGASFHTQPSRLYLTDTERAEIKAFRLRFRHICRESEKRKLARAFRILDLPPEIRNRIYEYALEHENSGKKVQNSGKEVQDSGKKVLAVTVAPQLARVCKTFRAEVLPLFFADTEFLLPIGTNLEHRARYRKDRISSPAHQQKRSGVLNFKQPVKKAIRDAGNGAIFRNVTFQIFEISVTGFKKGGMPSHLCIAEVKLSVRRGQLLVETTEKGAHPLSDYNSRWRSYEAKDQDVNKVIEQLRRVAAIVSGKSEFKGLKLRDLERMAKVFRFTEPTEIVRRED